MLYNNLLGRIITSLRSIVLPMFIFTIPISAQGSKINISGIVVDSLTGESLAGVTVILNDGKFGSITHKNGDFLLAGIPLQSYSIEVRSIGYNTYKEVLPLYKDTSIIIALSKNLLEFNEVKIKGNKSFNDDISKVSTELTEADLIKYRGQTLGEALGEVSGVTVLQTGPSIAKPVIRGMHSQRIVIINGGLEQEGQQWGAEHAPEIDPFAPNKIEVLKGASGIEFGAGAIGGVIRMIPRQLPKDYGIAGFLQLNAFSNNRQGAASLLLEDKVPFLPFLSWQGQVSVRKAGNSSAADYVLGNTGFEELNGSFTLGLSLGDLVFKSHYSHFGTELGIYKGSHIGNLSDLQRAISYGRPPVDYSFTYKIDPPKQVITHDLVSFEAEYKLSETINLESIYGIQFNHREEYDARRRWFDSTTLAPTRPAFDLELNTHSLDFKLKYHYTDKFFGSTGVSGMYQLNTGNSLSYLIPNFKSYSGSIFANANYILGVISFNAGIRYDYRHDRIFPYAQKNIPDTTLKYNSITAAIGTSYNVFQNAKVLLNIESAWRPPSINELYSNGVHHGTAQYEIGKQDLKPERSNSFELSFNYDDGDLITEINGYYNLIENYISLYPNPQPTLTLRGLFPTFNYIQNNAVLRGIDATIQYAISSYYTLGLVFSTIRGSNSENDEPLFQMPADRIKIKNHFHLPDFLNVSKSYLEITTNLTAGQKLYKEGIDYLNPPKGYVLFDAEFGCNAELFGTQTKLHFSVKNLLNTSYRDYLSRYRYFADDTGRNFVLRIYIPIGKNNL